MLWRSHKKSTIAKSRSSSRWHEKRLAFGGQRATAGSEVRGQMEDLGKIRRRYALKAAVRQHTQPELNRYELLNSVFHEAMSWYDRTTERRKPAERWR